MGASAAAVVADLELLEVPARGGEFPFVGEPPRSSVRARCFPLSELRREPGAEDCFFFSARAISSSF